MYVYLYGDFILMNFRLHFAIFFVDIEFFIAHVIKIYKSFALITTKLIVEIIIITWKLTITKYNDLNKGTFSRLRGVSQRFL